MIRSRLAILLAEKGHKEGRKLTYRTVAEETKLSQGVLVRLNSQDFGRVDTETLDTLCTYFGCSVCDILEHDPGEKGQAGVKGQAGEKGQATE